MNNRVHTTITSVLAVALIIVSGCAASLKWDNALLVFQNTVAQEQFERADKARKEAEARVKELEVDETGSAPLGARGPYGGWLDTLTNGKDAVVIIAALLSVDGADNSTERLEAFASALESVEGKTDSKIFKLLNNHVQTCQSNPQCGASLGAVLDHLFAKK